MNAFLSFVSPKTNQQTNKQQQLKRFEKISLNVGEQIQVKFSLTVDDLSYYGIDEERIYEEGTFVVSVGGLSSTFTLLA